MSATPLAPSIAPFIAGDEAPATAGQHKRSIDGAAEHGKNSGRRLSHSLASVSQTFSLALGTQVWGEEQERPAGGDQGGQDRGEEEYVEGYEEDSPHGERVGKEELPEYNVAL